MNKGPDKNEKPRGYCSVCNRYYFDRNGLDPKRLQVNQSAQGVCQVNRHGCARIKDEAKPKQAPSEQERPWSLIFTRT